ncbi:C-Jun-amino-terminal kinase-interacting protein 4-like isoform X2 [Ranitomeya imitator]|uniref:C-Jun-amino-terminal kinase-interacting protein 4-like isoform X2 n=1 Tax=Ranitomeya imitator TaxID=111125 RepID=UPI0037E92BFC
MMDEKLEEIFWGEAENRTSMEVYDEVVTSMAGSIYSELEKLVGSYGQEAVTGLMPLMVSVLESLATTCTRARENEDQLEMVQEDKQRLLIQYERERDGRKRAEERCIEMEDGIEQERKLFKTSFLNIEAQNKNMELKARSYADQIVGLEEQKTLLNKELALLTQFNAKIVNSYKELKYQRSLSSDAARLSGPNASLQGMSGSIPCLDFWTFLCLLGSTSCGRHARREKKLTLLDFQEAPSSLERRLPLGSYPNNLSEKVPTEECKTVITFTSPLKDERPPQAEDSPLPRIPSVVDDIVNSTPELKLQMEASEASTPKGISDLEEEAPDRNNDSLFAEMFGTSPEFIADVDEGADLQGGNPVDALMIENAQLRDAQNEVDMARKSLIARVEELTAERESLKSEIETAVQNLSRCEFKLRETDQDLQMTRIELEETRKLCREDAEVDIPAAQRKRFTRAEMARVLMERNQYKEKLMELQDAIRRTEMLRFDRLFSSTGPQVKAVTPPPTPSIGLNRSQSSAAMFSAGGKSVIRNQSINFYTPNTSDDVDAVSLRGKKHEHYRHIRSHIWKEHGRAQVYGWSIPPILKNAVDSQVESELGNAPVLVQLRLLDQKDPRTKLWCATATSTTDSMDKSNEVHGTHLGSIAWICSGTHTVSEIMVIDASSSNHVMDQFEIHNAHVLCVSYVPAHRLNCVEGEEGCRDVNRDATIWLGTQEGSLLIHSAVSDWRTCLQKIQLKDSIHSITHNNNRVVTTLGDGTLAIFKRNSTRNWDLDNPKVVDLGRPQQSIRCSAAVYGDVWCGYRNRIYVMDPRMAKTKIWFEATPRPESQVRHIAAARDGVWVSVRLDSILRLFHPETGQPLQELELEPFIQRMLGSSYLISMAQVSALSAFGERLWVGTSCGVIVSIPFSKGTNEQSGEVKENKDILNQGGPFCSTEYAQISFHGHRDSVKFFACVPGCINPSLPGGSSESTRISSILVMSGGEGYINFKIGDENGDTEEGYGELLQTNPRYRRSERSHLIVWQIQSP